MKHYKNLSDAFLTCEAIGSEVRLEILEQIIEHKTINLNEIATNLHLTNGAITKHIKKLENVGLIKVTVNKGKRGFQKLCSISQDKLLIDISNDALEEDCIINEIPFGLYSDFSVAGSCGLASETGYIGSRDEASSFLSPNRAEASCLWFEKGYVTYLLPPIKPNVKIEEIRFVFEISPCIITAEQNSVSKVSFLLDNTDLGSGEITSPLSVRRGFLTPDWYDSFLPQYGVYKTLRITQKGTYFDGEKISPQTLSAFKNPNRFTFSTRSGLILYGRNFGDYNAGLKYIIQNS